MRKRILVVKDQEDHCQIIRDMLSTTGYQIAEAADGEEALAANSKRAARPHFDGCPTAGHGRLDGERAVSRPIPHSDRSRSSQSLPTRSAAKRRMRGPRAVTIKCLSLLARASCWRKFAISCHSTGTIRAEPAPIEPPKSLRGPISPEATGRVFSLEGALTARRSDYQIVARTVGVTITKARCYIRRLACRRHSRGRWALGPRNTSGETSTANALDFMCAQRTSASRCCSCDSVRQEGARTPIAKLLFGVSADERVAGAD
jgi:hypothetical protein